MTAPAHTYQRMIEDALVTLLQADASVAYTYQDLKGEDYAPVIMRSWKTSQEVKRLTVIAHCKDLTNAMLDPLGRSAQWRVTATIAVYANIAHDRDNDNADRCQGACERFLKGLTPATLTAALVVGSGITVDGITAAEEADAADEAQGTLLRVSAATVHFRVT